MGRSVLIVDDECLIRMAAVLIVEGAGYAAVEAENADDAIAKLESNADIVTVMTDVNMPGSMDGWQLSHLIRDRWPLIGLIVASGRAFTDTALMPRSLKLISKPYTPDKVTNALRGFAN